MHPFPVKCDDRICYPKRIASAIQNHAKRLSLQKHTQAVTHVITFEGELFY